MDEQNEKIATLEKRIAELVKIIDDMQYDINEMKYYIYDCFLREFPKYN